MRERKIIPLEVKSGAPARLKSMSLFLDEHPHCHQRLVFYAGNIELHPSYRLKYMPLYTRLIAPTKDP